MFLSQDLGGTMVTVEVVHEKPLQVVMETLLYFQKSDGAQVKNFKTTKDSASVKACLKQFVEENPVIIVSIDYIVAIETVVIVKVKTVWLPLQPRSSSR